MTIAQSQQRDLSDRAKQIVAAADSLLAELGPDNVSMREVAERAHVNKALIFYYFGSRAKLFDAVLQGYQRRHSAALDRAFGLKGTPYDRVHHALDCYMDFLEDNQLFARLAQQEMSRTVHKLAPIRDCLADLHDRITRVFDGALPPCGPLSAHQMFLTVTSTMLGYYSCADAIAEFFRPEPIGPRSLDDRRAHVHWLADTVIDRLSTSR